MRMSRDQLRDFAEIRFVREVQYRIGCTAVDGIVGPETRRKWAEHIIDHQMAAPCVAITSRSALIKNVQAALGTTADGIPGPVTWRVWVHHAYPEAIAAGVFPIPIYRGAEPVMSSGFNAGRGPNFDRRPKPGHHYGVDLEYLRDMSKPPPPGWQEHHFGYRAARQFYGPPVPVYAVWPGEVVSAKQLDVSEEYGGKRWRVKVYHGELPGLGHTLTWSVHHRELLVAKGDIVEADTPIAVLGDTGARGAPHDHHEAWRSRGKLHRTESPFNPWPIFNELRRVECNELY